MKTLTVPIKEIYDSCDTGPHGDRHDLLGHKFYEWIAAQFAPGIIVEAGTLKGRSARSFSRGAPSSLVISYDIVYRSHLDSTGDPDAHDHILMYDNIITKAPMDINEINPAWFSKVDIIYLDISHNGRDEKVFLERIEPHFKGILIMDDVDDGKQYPGLQNVFQNITREKHLLPKLIAASRGTGVIPYGDWTIKIIAHGE